MPSQSSVHHVGPPPTAPASRWRERPRSGVYPATQCPFREDESIDEAGLVAAVEDVASVPGIEGVVCNGHTGEIMSLSPDERARVTQLTAEGVARANQRTGRRAAKWLLGRFPSPVFRRPVRPLSIEQLTGIRGGLEALGLTCPHDPALASAAPRERRRSECTTAGRS